MSKIQTARSATIVLLAVLAFALGACNKGGNDDSAAGPPTIQSQVHFGATECVDYTGAGDPIYLNRRLGQMADGRRCTLKLCFAQSVAEPECMYNCPPDRVLGCN